MKSKEQLLESYLKRALKTLGPDEVAKIVVARFKRQGYPKHLRRFI
jgi:hypothetical protein